LWEQVPTVSQEQAIFSTDPYVVYRDILPSAQHRAISTLARKTNHVERFHGTVRQWVSRLVRASFSFSKTLANHIGAIPYFLCEYKLTKWTAFPV
jgi:insertion element IS1 protein InsB